LVDTPLADGTYDAFVVWAESRDDDHPALELTITTGTHKGAMVHVRAARTRRDSACPAPCLWKTPRRAWSGDGVVTAW